jgi:hypothetical protein
MRTWAPDCCFFLSSLLAKLFCPKGIRIFGAAGNSAATACIAHKSLRILRAMQAN